MLCINNSFFIETTRIFCLLNYMYSVLKWSKTYCLNTLLEILNLKNDSSWNKPIFLIAIPNDISLVYNGSLRVKIAKKEVRKILHIAYVFEVIFEWRIFHLFIIWNCFSFISMQFNICSFKHLFTCVHSLKFTMSLPPVLEIKK